MTPERVKAAKTMREGGATFTQIGKVLGVSRSSVSRALSR